jgi:GT2 family glycosyltransferase
LSQFFQPLNARFSFVTPSYNGAAKLPPLLDSLFTSLFFGNNEIIVVLDGSTDHSRQVLEPYLEKGCRLVEQENKGRSAARNAGISMSKNSQLFFLDDDMRLLPNSCHQHLEHHVNHPNSILVGHVILDRSKFRTDFHRYMGHVFNDWGKGFEEKTGITAQKFKFSSAHLSMPKSIFEQLGGFDERLTDAEDYDFGMRALQAGIPIYYDPSIVAYHDDFPTCKKYIERQIEYKLSHKRLKELGKTYAVEVFTEAEKPKGAIKTLLLSILSQDFWVNGIDQELFVFVPKPWRYKLYSTVVYAHKLKGLGLLG